MVSPFTFSRIPVIHFGAGKFKTLPDIIGNMGETVLIITGAHSFQSSGKKDQLESLILGWGFRGRTGCGAVGILSVCVFQDVLGSIAG